MTENQKLREAFEAYITDNGKWPNAILKAPGGQYLLLRTSVAWQDWKACAEALALPTAEQVDDINVAESFTSVTKTAAPVGERERFEKEMTRLFGYSPHAFGKDRNGDYAERHIDEFYMVWQARAALSAGDAGWQPIETAPKDGTNVLLVNRKGNQAAGLWMDSLSGEGWYLRGGNHPDTFFNDHHGPTHWMPLPPAPAMRKGQL